MICCCCLLARAAQYRSAKFGLYAFVIAAFAINSLATFPVALAEPAANPAHSESRTIILAQAETQSEARAMVNLMNQLDGLNRDLNKLRGKIEELSNNILNAEKRQKDMYLDLDTRLRRIEATNTELAENARKAGEAMSAMQVRIDQLERSAANASSGGSPDVTNEDDLSATDGAGKPSSGGSQRMNAVVHSAYEEAMVKYRERAYQDAIKAFQVIVTRFPEHPLAANAQYWTGDSFYQLRAYRAAIDAQKLLLVSYPDSGKVPDALLIMGSAQLGLGDAVAARQSWEQVMANYPESRAAAKAADRLKRLP
jgi:tol-pal system protein YbgF